MGSHGPSRRDVLRAAGLVAAGAWITTGCGSQEVTSNGPPSLSAVGASADIENEVLTLQTAASLENLGVYAYTEALKRLHRGQFGSPPPVVVAFAERVREHHAEHAKALNRVLTAMGKRPYTQPDPQMLLTVKDGLPALRSIHDLSEFSVVFEDAVAQTHVRNLGELTDARAVAVTAQIAPVEQQHVALLYVVEGKYPAPNDFTPTSQARPSTDVT
ncbi:MAG TPA: ferritin-like domain-containing protein [Mycobacteriales bacterium]|nr:ferritin-like domain-containing protein [Mycobacteriales bacterium]